MGKTTVRKPRPKKAPVQKLCEYKNKHPKSTKSIKSFGA